MIHRQEVHDALMLVDDNILKLDTIDPAYINMVDRPNGSYDVQRIIERMKFIFCYFAICYIFNC